MAKPCHFTREIEKLNTMNPLTNAGEMFEVECCWLLHSKVKMYGNSLRNIYVAVEILDRIQLLFCNGFVDISDQVPPISMDAKYKSIAG